ncbi:MAG: hypothetical protein IPP47_34110 [Bryobacterales bacterium]|nr:hypothetical protein [Bryobacterales bacterium]
MRAFAMAFLVVTAGSPVFADSIVASINSPYALGGTVTAIDLTSVAVGPSPVINTAAYSVAFTPGTDPDTGVVQGSLAGKYAAPIMGNGSPWPGKYFSTGTAGNSITISFTTAQTGLAFLWGSVDTYNGVTVSFNDGAVTYTGSQVAAAAAILPNGGQGPGGSAYVAINSTPGFTFNNVTFASTNYALELPMSRRRRQSFKFLDGA